MHEGEKNLTIITETDGTEPQAPVVPRSPRHAARREQFLPNIASNNLSAEPPTKPLGKVPQPARRRTPQQPIANSNVQQSGLQPPTPPALMLNTARPTLPNSALTSSSNQPFDDITIGAAVVHIAESLLQPTKGASVSQNPGGTRSLI